MPQPNSTGPQDPVLSGADTMTTPFSLEDRWSSTTGHVTGLALLFMSAGMFVSAIVGLVAGSAGLALLGATAITALLGAEIGRASCRERV